MVSIQIAVHLQIQVQLLFTKYYNINCFLCVLSKQYYRHLQDTPQSSILTYWKHLSAVFIGCIALFAFEMSERGAQLKNPFYTIWATNTGTNFAVNFFSLLYNEYNFYIICNHFFRPNSIQMAFIILALLSGICYFVFLMFMIWRVFCNISIRRSALPSMSNARRLHYEGIIYRFKFLMLATVLCAFVTIVEFVLGQVNKFLSINSKLYIVLN